MNNIFVGNLDFTATKEQVRKLFEEFGTVAGVAVVEKRKGKSRGFAFVDMPNEDQKNLAIATLEGREFMGRPLIVNPMRPKVPKPSKHFQNKKKWEEREQRGHQRDDRSEKPYGKPQAAYKPYRRDDRDSKPSYGKPKSNYKPYRQDDRESKPYAKSQGDYKPYRQDDRQERSYSKPSSSSSDTRPWGKSKRASESAPKKSYGKPGGSSKSKHFGQFYGKSSKPNLKSGYGTKSWPKKIQ